uniref:Vitellogenin receptor n=1 Tax=Acrobeloides nanus TaxID=290746 RepID=A0A914D511_9BILA
MIAYDDNGNHTVLVEHNISYPVDLAVDWIHGLLFWSDKNWNTINVMDLNTKQRKVLFKENIERRQAIAVDPSKGLIFWTDDYNNAIERASMDGNDRMLFSVDELGLRTVRVYHNVAQPELPNKCDQHTCGNGAICLPKGNSFDNEGKPQSRIGLPYSCVCADGYTTGKEPNTCVLII